MMLITMTVLAKRKCISVIQCNPCVVIIITDVKVFWE